MPKIVYITSTGDEYVVDAASGQSAMEAAVQNMVPGIDGDCGGSGACGTCHVYVDAAWLESAGPAREGIEQDMLAFSDARAANSRLACQIKISADLDGLVLHMPADQH